MQRVRNYTPAGICFVISIVLPLFSVGCERTVNRTAERRIREALPALLGSARQYKVHVEGSPERTLGGRLAHVTIDGDDVDLRDGLLLDHLHLELIGVQYDTGQHQVHAIKEARFEATLSADSLDEYLAGEAPQRETIRHVHVSFDTGNHVTIAAERLLLGVAVPFQLSGPLRIVGKRRLQVDPTRLVVIGVPITGAPLRFLLERFEGASDLSTLPFPVEITNIRTAPGTLTLAGVADVVTILQRARVETKVETKVEKQ